MPKIFPQWYHKHQELPSLPSNGNIDRIDKCRQNRKEPLDGVSLPAFFPIFQIKKNSPTIQNATRSNSLEKTFPQQKYSWHSTWRSRVWKQKLDHPNKKKSRKNSAVFFPRLWCFVLCWSCSLLSRAQFSPYLFAEKKKTSSLKS